MRQLLALLGLLLAVVASRASAQQPALDESRARAAALYRASVKAFAEHRYRDAIQRSTEADRVLPSPANAYNIARAYEALGDTSHALAAYRDYLHRSPGAEDREHVKHRVARHERRLAASGVQQVTLRSSPNGASVWLDDVSVGTTPWTVDLPPGKHRVRMVLSGYEDASQAFDVSLERAQDVELQLTALRSAHPELTLRPLAALPTVVLEEPAPAPPPAPIVLNEAPPATPAEPATQPLQSETRPSDTHPTHRSGRTLRTLGFIALATGTAGLGGALAFEVMRQSAENDARHESEQIRYAHDLETVRDRRNIARVLFASGGGAALGGLVLLGVAASMDSDDDASSETASSADLSVACAPRGCGVSLRGRY
jgi:tetratricopeptide (TPR) repeat protein